MRSEFVGNVFRTFDTLFGVDAGTIGHHFGFCDAKMVTRGTLIYDNARVVRPHEVLENNLV